MIQHVNTGTVITVNLKSSWDSHMCEPLFKACFVEGTGVWKKPLLCLETTIRACIKIDSVKKVEMETGTQVKIEKP